MPGDLPDRAALAAAVGRIHDHLIGLTDALGELHALLAPDEAVVETAEPSPMRRVWLELGGDGDIEEEQLPIHLTCLAQRLGPGPKLDAVLATGVPQELPSSPELDDLVAELDPQLADAVRLMVQLAEHDTTLIWIDTKTSQSTVHIGRIGDCYEEVRTAVNDLLSAPPEASRDSVVIRAVWLDSLLRRLIPVDRSHEPMRLVPPEKGSAWANALEASLDAVRRISKQADAAVEAGCPPQDIPMTEAVSHHHTRMNTSLVLHVEPEQDNKVLWCLRVWAGRDNHGTFSAVDNARVIFGRDPNPRSIPGGRHVATEAKHRP
ncbi:hypothetical protein JOF56_005177 [Kibdelosporangium banguiense]|uniref:Uncharacterized protein n=1 Tax=Kibdelosporangium banguiense TaxID=1365924 RepID=A0ABS4TK43_9PSEU|nr:hypothetical protein [Kibdelosporangium banguiense]MBP2324792.1 hypothetical protein [Kibdelosporangium banguiense]